VAEAVASYLLVSSPSSSAMPSRPDVRPAGNATIAVFVLILIFYTCVLILVSHVRPVDGVLILLIYICLHTSEARRRCSQYYF
jgi:hypothetical protein